MRGEGGGESGACEGREEGNRAHARGGGEEGNQECTQISVFSPKKVGPNSLLSKSS